MSDTIIDSELNLNEALITTVLGKPEQINVLATSNSERNLYNGKWYRQKGNTCFLHSVVNAMLPLGIQPSFDFVRTLNTSYETGVNLPQIVALMSTLPQTTKISFELIPRPLNQEDIQKMTSGNYTIVLPIDSNKLYERHTQKPNYHYVSIISTCPDINSAQIIDANNGSQIRPVNDLIKISYPYFIKICT